MKSNLLSSKNLICLKAVTKKVAHFKTLWMNFGICPQAEWIWENPLKAYQAKLLTHHGLAPRLKKV